MHHTLTTVLGLSIATATVAAAQQEFDDVVIKTMHVAGNVYMLEGSGGNIGVSAGDDGLLVIDDQFAPLAQKIESALEALGKGKPRFILNTHWHGDHTGGNEHFGKTAPIIAHTNVRKRLSTRQTLFGRDVGPLSKEGLPMITFDESLSLHFNGEEIRVVHHPHSHTDGDSVIHFTGSNVVHMGDLFFSGRFPFVDVEHGGDVVGLAENVAGLIGQLNTDVKLIPGHGPVSTVEDLKRYLHMLEQTTEIVRKRMSDGLTLKQIQDAGLPEKYADWGSGFISTEQWLAIVHASLSRRQN